MTLQLESANTDQACVEESQGRRESDQTGAAKTVKRGVSGNSNRMAPV